MNPVSADIPAAGWYGFSPQTPWNVAIRLQQHPVTASLPPWSPGAHQGGEAHPVSSDASTGPVHTLVTFLTL